jgi:hypothetical protein
MDLIIKKVGRPKKYETEDEYKDARRQYNLKYYNNPNNKPIFKYKSKINEEKHKNSFKCELCGGFYKLTPYYHNKTLKHITIINGMTNN